MMIKNPPADSWRKSNLGTIPLSTKPFIFAAMDIVKKYFPEFSSLQLKQFELLGSLYAEWNEKINVISRKDIENIYERHVLHSLGIAKVISFRPGTKILDVGTGGGFPGIPLAILFPEVSFHLIDSIGKKIKVVNAVAEVLQLDNVSGEHKRLESAKGSYDFIVSRAVTGIPQFVAWCRGRVIKKNSNALPNGILYLKGGDFAEELAEIRQHSKIYLLSKYFEEEFFETKKLVHVWNPERRK